MLKLIPLVAFHLKTFNRFSLDAFPKNLFHFLHIKNEPFFYNLNSIKRNHNNLSFLDPNSQKNFFQTDFCSIVATPYNFSSYFKRVLPPDFNIVYSQQKTKQAGTGPSRRHIQGSKIAKRLPSVKYSFTVVETRKFFEIFFLKKLHTKKMDRVARRGSLPRAPGALTSHNAEKLKRGTL